MAGSVFDKSSVVIDRSNHLSVREKHLQGQHLGNEWLTHTDLEEILKKASLKEKVHILPLDSQNIGHALHLARRDHEGGEEDYHIPFLLSDGSHWLSVIVTVKQNPPHLDIAIKDSMINEAKKQNLITLFDNAVQYEGYERKNDDSQEYQYLHAFPDIPRGIDFPETPQQSDGWSCGYRAISTLLKDLDGVSTDSPLNALLQAQESNALKKATFDLLAPNGDTAQTVKPASTVTERMIEVVTPDVSQSIKSTTMAQPPQDTLPVLDQATKLSDWHDALVATDTGAPLSLLTQWEQALAAKINKAPAASVTTTLSSTVSLEADYQLALKLQLEEITEYKKTASL